MQLPDRSTLAAGAASVAGWAIVKYAIPAACAAAGGIGALICGIAANITPSEWAAAIGTAATLASHFTPDSIKDIAVKLNTDVEAVAAIIPRTYDEYPPDGGITTGDIPNVVTNMKTKDGSPVD